MLQAISAIIQNITAKCYIFLFVRSSLVTSITLFNIPCIIFGNTNEKIEMKKKNWNFARFLFFFFQMKTSLGKDKRLNHTKQTKELKTKKKVLYLVRGSTIIYEQFNCIDLYAREGFFFYSIIHQNKRLFKTVQF